VIANGETEGAHRRQLSQMRLAAWLTTGIAAWYTVLAFLVLSPDVVYSIDNAIKYLQARSLVEHRFLAMPLKYRGAFIDPATHFRPFARPFVFMSHGEPQSIFPTAGALLAAPFSGWGFTGLTIPALIGAAMLLFVAAWFARGTPGANLVPLVLGLATPLWFHAVIPNEHPLSAALTTAALGLALRDASSRRLLLAGVLVGMGAALRDEALLIAPGVAAARWLAGSRGRQLASDTALIATGVVSVIVVNTIIDVGVYGRPPSAHLLHAVAPLQDYMNPGAAAALPRLRVMPWRERFDVLVTYWLLGRGTLWLAPICLTMLLAAAAVRRTTGSALGLLAVVGAVATVATLDVSALLSAPKFVAGLFRLCPFLVFALIPVPSPFRSSLARRGALVASAAYVIVALVGLNTAGGKSLGPRLLMPIIPLLVVAACESIVLWTAQFRVRRRVDGLVGLTGVFLIVAAGVIELGGTIPAYVGRVNGDRGAATALGQAPEEVIVLDDPFLLQAVAPLYFERVVLLTTNQGAARSLAEQLDAARIRRFLLVSRTTSPSLRFAPFTLAAERRESRLIVQSWRR
jgi:hypothetical protein